MVAMQSEYFDAGDMDSTILERRQETKNVWHNAQCFPV